MDVNQALLEKVSIGTGDRRNISSAISQAFAEAVTSFAVLPRSESWVLCKAVNTVVSAIT